MAFQAGTGSYYSDSWEKPVGNASPASSFGEGSPSSSPEAMDERAKLSSADVSNAARAAGSQAMSKGKAMGSEMMAKTREAGENLKEKARHMDDNKRAEQAARMSGEVIGRGLKKTSSVLKGFQRGISSGLGHKKSDAEGASEEGKIEENDETQ